MTKFRKWGLASESHAWVAVIKLAATSTEFTRIEARDVADYSFTKRCLHKGGGGGQRYKDSFSVSVSSYTLTEKLC